MVTEKVDFDLPLWVDSERTMNVLFTQLLTLIHCQLFLGNSTLVFPRKISFPSPFEGHHKYLRQNDQQKVWQSANTHTRQTSGTRPCIILAAVFLWHGFCKSHS
jgi:hypothetical protein